MNAFLDAVWALAAVAVTTLGGILLHRLSEWLRLRGDAEVRGYLLATLDRALEFGQAEAKRRASNGEVAAIRNMAAEIARGYVQDRVPDALARFAIDTVALDQMIRARLPKRPAFPGAADGG